MRNGPTNFRLGHFHVCLIVTNETGKDHDHRNTNLLFEKFPLFNTLQAKVNSTTEYNSTPRRSFLSKLSTSEVDFLNHPPCSLGENDFIENLKKHWAVYYDLYGSKKKYGKLGLPFRSESDNIGKPFPSLNVRGIATHTR